MTQAQPPALKLYLLGPMALRDAAGGDITPRGKKAQALIALLALAPRRQRTRVWLRDKLWSASDENKSATSLRQVIFELRRDLGAMFDAAFDVNRHSIALNDAVVWIDYLAVRQDPAILRDLNVVAEVDLLEGIDVKDEEFEDWLMLERQVWAEKAPAYFEGLSSLEPVPVAPAAHLLMPDVPTSRPAKIAIGMLPNIQQGSDGDTVHLADFVIESIGKSLDELHDVDIFDLRDPQLPSECIVGASDADFLVRVRVLQIRHSITLTFFLYEADRMTLEWSQSIQTSVEETLSWDSYVLAGFISQNVDRLSKSIEAKSAAFGVPQQSDLLVGYTALNLMYRLDRDALENTERMLADTKTGTNEVMSAALRSYAATFKIGENLGVLDEASSTDAARLAHQALDDNPFNAVSLACLGHTMGYVFHDHSTAGQLLERALNLNQNQAFVWDHYALHKLYTGDYDAAHKAAERAVYLGSYSPLSYSYDTTLAMTSTMLGQHQKAIQSSKRALRKQPKFSAAQRYLVVNYAQTGQDENAAQAYSDLLATDPDFKDVEVQRARFRITQKQKQDELLGAIKPLI